LTLQIEGAGLSLKHAQLKFDGFKNFDVIDFESENGTWMNIPKEGVEIKNNESFSIGPYIVKFTFGHKIEQI
jgi:pSer/pThr/pTyr-binding forkhead associated (FHA) protein